MQSSSDSMASLLAYVSGGESDAGTPLTSSNPKLALESGTAANSLSRARQQEISATRGRMRELSEIVQLNEMDSSRGFNGERPPYTTYEQGLAVLQRFYLGIIIFMAIDVIALVRLSLAIGMDLDGHLQLIPCDKHYKDILQWAYAISPDTERERFLTKAAAFWRPASFGAEHVERILPMTDGQSSLVAHLKGGFVIQMCLRHLNALQYTSLQLELQIEPGRSTPSADIRAAYQRHITTPLSMSPGLESFRETVEHVAGLLQQGLLDSIRAIEVMLIGGIQVSVFLYRGHPTTQVSDGLRSTIARLPGLSFPRRPAYVLIITTYSNSILAARDRDLGNYIQTVLIDCHEIDNEQHRQSLFGIASGLASPELGTHPNMELSSPSGSSNDTVEAQIAGISGPTFNTTSTISPSRLSAYGTEICQYPGCTRTIRGTAKNRQTSMRKHLETHKPIEARRTKVCDVCGKRYTRSDFLSNHRRDAHRIVNPRAIGPRRSN